MKRLATFASVILFSVAASASDDAVRCAETGIQVPGWSAEERDRVCTAAAAAIDFLRGAGLGYADGLTIRPLPPTGDPAEARVIGSCNASGNEIVLLSYDASVVVSRKYPPAFDMPMSPALWQSFISHEMAHAVTLQNFAARAKRATASEYIAAVVQLATLPSELRQAILRRYDAEGFGDPSEIRLLMYEMNPPVFGVMAYRHYVALGDRGPAFLARLLREGLDH
jgi:hypothetical protein